MRESRPVSDTAVAEQIYKIFPNDLNSQGNVFGGLIMAEMDRLAVVVAERHSRCLCVTVGVDAVHFIAPATGADTLVFAAACNRAWNSSMEIGVRVEAEIAHTGQRRHILSAYLTFIALDEAGRPSTVPTVEPRSRAEHLRYEAAAVRREQRLATAHNLKQLQNGESSA